MKSLYLKIGRYEIETLVLKEGDPSQPDEIDIRTDCENEALIRTKASTVLRERFWQLQDDVLSDELTQCFAMQVAAGVAVNLAVLGEPIEKHMADDICGSLALFWARLRNKDRWSLKSVQVPKANVLNEKNGQLRRGYEFPSEGRFYVYPTAVRETGLYRGVLPCSWLQGTVLHEATHVCLERCLDPLWVDAGNLGWGGTLPGTLVRYPGGAVSKIVNLRPDECATEYGALTKEDDRAESVVAFLSGGRLHESRRALLLRELLGHHQNPRDWKVEEIDCALPLPQIVLRLLPESSGSFFCPLPGAGMEPRKEPTVYDVDEYRRLFI